MLVKTQRRRISPRTRRRCLAIRGFFKKALDTCTTASQFLTKHESTAFNTEQLTKKIVDLEDRLNAISNASIGRGNNVESSAVQVLHDALDNDEPTHVLETELLYKTSENRYKGCFSRQSQNNSESDCIENSLRNENSNILNSGIKKECNNKKSLESKIYTSEHAYMAQNFSVYREENEQYTRKRRTKKHCSEHRPKHSKHIVSEYHEEENQPVRRNGKHSKRSKLTKKTSAIVNYEDNLNQNYIAQIIQKQYEPYNIVDKRNSEVSQFSVPICRDRSSLENTNLANDFECLNDNNNEITAVKQDFFNYEPKIKHKRHRKTKPSQVSEDEANLYDFIPVKELSSPKSRRKFVEEQMIAQTLHREVPPSPRTNRPRLNLTVKHYTEYDDYLNIKKDNNENNNDIASDVALQDTTDRLLEGGATLVQDTTTENTLRGDENVSKSNKILETRDETLIEIKETLQRFLQEVKNENSINGIPESHQGNIGYGTSNPVLPMLNSCYYPVVPICPVNYMQSAFVPSTSTCAACAQSNDSQGTVAEQLMKQIHQSAVPGFYDSDYQNHVNDNVFTPQKRQLSSRGAGSGKIFNSCDVDVQIPTLKCISNSSATIGSKLMSKECFSGPKESVCDFDMKEWKVESQSVSESAMYCSKNEHRIKQDGIMQKESNRWKKFFKSFGTVKKCKSTTKNEDSSSQLSDSKHLHDSPRIIFDRNLLSRKSSYQLQADMPSYLNDNLYYHDNYYLKEVEVKCVATQSERPKRYLFGLFSKRQPDKIMYPSKPGSKDKAERGCS